MVTIAVVGVYLREVEAGGYEKQVHNFLTPQGTLEHESVVFE